MVLFSVCVKLDHNDVGKYFKYGSENRIVGIADLVVIYSTVYFFVAFYPSFPSSITENNLAYSVFCVWMVIFTPKRVLYILVFA